MQFIPEHISNCGIVIFPVFFETCYLSFGNLTCCLPSVRTLVFALLKLALWQNFRYAGGGLEK
jgi:hypothetical protein